MKESLKKVIYQEDLMEQGSGFGAGLKDLYIKKNYRSILV